MIASELPLVTIGIPTYNRANGYLRETLETSINQTYSNIEIVVSDNCSSDNTEEVVKSISDSRIRYFRQAENIGANNNFNFCLKEAHGDYFLLFHDDDKIDDDFVETCLEVAHYRTDVGIIRTGTRLIDSNGEVFDSIPNMVGGLSTEDFFLGWFSRKTAYYLCSTLFNTQRLKEMNGFNSKTNLLQDVVAEVTLAAKYGRVDVKEVKASFRKHPDERTFGVKVSDWCEDSLFLLDLMCDLASTKKEQIREEGLRFFARLNYTWASKIKSPLERWMTYWMVYKKFNYHYSPMDFYIARNWHVRRVLRAKRKVMRAIVSN